MFEFTRLRPCRLAILSLFDPFFKIKHNNRYCWCITKGVKFLLSCLSVQSSNTTGRVRRPTSDALSEYVFCSQPTFQHFWVLCHTQRDTHTQTAKKVQQYFLKKTENKKRTVSVPRRCKFWASAGFFFPYLLTPFPNLIKVLFIFNQVVFHKLCQYFKSHLKGSLI